MFRAIIKRLSKSWVAIAGVIVLAAAASFVAALEPVTRGLVARDFMCLGCHLDSEYDPTLAGSPTRLHKATPEGGQARCVQCHVPEGWLASVYVYTHFVGPTDLFGHLREPAAKRPHPDILGPVEISPAPEAGGPPPYVAPVAKKAYRVRDRLMEYDSVTCRSCHIEAEIKPKRKRGQRAHARALKKKQTCAECHYNVVHREVDLRPLDLE